MATVTAVTAVPARLQRERPHEGDLATSEDLERHLRHEERRTGPRRLADSVGDVAVVEAVARVERLQQAKVRGTVR